MSVEMLRQRVAEAIRGEPMQGEPVWDLLHDSRKESYLDDADRVLAALESEQAKEVLLKRAKLHADFDAWEIHNRWQDFGTFMFQAGISHEVRNAVLTETYDFLTKLTKWVTKDSQGDEPGHQAGKSGHRDRAPLAFEPDEFTHTAELLRSDNDAVVSAALSNNINIILAALDAVPHLAKQVRLWSDHYDLVHAGEVEARERAETLATALRELIGVAEEDELNGWPNTAAFARARAALNDGTDKASEE